MHTKRRAIMSELLRHLRSLSTKFASDPWSWDGLGDAYNANGEYDRGIKKLEIAVGSVRLVVVGVTQQCIQCEG